MTAVAENSNNVSAQAPDPRVVEINRVLIGGEGRPANPVGAVTMFRGAVTAGSAAAAERLAALAAHGINRAANWQEAIGWLVKAADMGNASAQGQIRTLVGMEGAQVDGSWLDIARRIDLKGYLKAPALVQVRESPAIAMIEGLATPAMCRWLIARGGGRLAPGRVGDYSTGQWINDPIRTGLAAGFGLADTDVVLVMTQKRLELASGLRVIQQEAPHVLSYEVGQEYKAHFDFLVPGEPAFQHILDAMGQRVATCLTWLNDDYEGGETAFPKIDWKHKGKAGDSMLFLNVRSSDRKPDPMTLHAGTPVTQGRKWLLSQWVQRPAAASARKQGRKVAVDPRLVTAPGGSIASRVKAD
jgi:prolyl 4-hydroxylase